MPDNLIQVSSNRLALIERSIECLRRRRDGETVNEIAWKLSLTPKEVNKYIDRGLRASLTPTFEGLKKLEMSRLEEIGRILMSAIKDSDRLNTRAIEMYLKASEQRFRLAGSMVLVKKGPTHKGQVVDAPDQLDIIRDPGASDNVYEAVSAPAEGVG